MLELHLEAGLGKIVRQQIALRFKAHGEPLRQIIPPRRKHLIVPGFGGTLLPPRPTRLVPPPPERVSGVPLIVHELPRFFRVQTQCVEKIRHCLGSFPAALAKFRHPSQLQVIQGPGWAS